MKVVNDVLSLLLVLATTFGVPNGVWVVVGTIVSGIAINAGSKWLNRRAEARDDRKDYREEIKELREALRVQGEKIDKLEEEVTQWRNQFYAEQNHTARLENAILKKGDDLPPRPPTP